MKRCIVFTIVIPCLAAALLAPPLSAQHRITEDNRPEKRSSFSIGFKLHYAWWEPVWGKTEPVELVSLTYLKYGVTGVEYKGISSFQYNPYISIGLGKSWYMSISYTFGHYGGIGGNAFAFPIGPGTFLFASSYPKQMHVINHSVRADKHDADMLFNRTVKSWFKVYFGFKYQGYTLKDTIRTNVAVPASIDWNYVPWRFKSTMLFHSFGGGLGFGFTVHLVQNLFLLPNISGLLLIGKDYTPGTSKFHTLFHNLFAAVDQSSNRKNYALLGGIGSLSLAYVIPAAHLTIDGGFRAQYLYYTDKPKAEIKRRNEVFWGPYLGVTASF